MDAEQGRNDFGKNDFEAGSIEILIDELERMLRWLNVADEETPIYDQVAHGLDFNPLERYRTNLA